MMEETLLCHQDIAYKNMKIKEYMNHLISKNNNQRCECCPYGYHVNLDFVEFAKDISNSHNELQKIRRYQRKLERAQNNILNNHEGISENIKESFTVKRDVAQELMCSSSESNSPNYVTDIKVDLKSQTNEIIYIPNNTDDCGSRSSDESVIQSASCQNDLNNSNARNIFKGIYLPDDNYKKASSSKSFVVSYEHLMSIREQMSASLKRVQDLELEVKNVHELREKLDRLTEENRELQNQLEISNSGSELIKKINIEATKWRQLTDLPTQLLPNLERIVQFKKPGKSRSTQTDVNGNLIVDTLSYLSYATNDCHTQAQSETATISPKIHRRNFGVTVRPTHHHFTQQISFSSKAFKPDESLVTFDNWIGFSTRNEMEKKIGVLIHNLLCFFFKNMYQDAVDSLKNELVFSSFKYKSLQSNASQTLPTRMTDNGTQVTSCEYYHHKSVQVQPIQWNKYANTRQYSLVESGVATDKVILAHRNTQTSLNNLMHISTQVNLKPLSQDHSGQYEYRTTVANISSNTDPNLIDDLISEQIETTMALIQEELKNEIESQSAKKGVVDTLEMGEIVIIGRPVVSSSSDYSYMSHTKETQSRSAIKKVESVVSDHQPSVVNCNIVGNSQERTSRNLVRSKINYIDFPQESIEELSGNKRLMSDSLSSSLALKVDTNVGTPSSTNEDFSPEISDSTASSPMEGCYYTSDRRIDYRNIDQIEECDEAAEEKVESVTETEKTLQSNGDTVRLGNLSSVKQDGDTSSGPEFPENISEACNLVAIWMNDSTTTCSKDLNESLAIIRHFWFSLTKGSALNMKFYLDKFKSFNPTLQERIINMTDANGNTCLHYAVSEGRWSTVRQILETEQADVSKTNKAGYTVLMLAAVSDVLDEAALRLLISKSEVDKKSQNDSRQTALMIAASQGKAQLVQLLLEAGASVNVTDSDGSSALMCACDNGHLEVVRIFLARSDIDTELEDNAGSNAMKVALDNSHKDIALLIFAKNNLQKGSLRSKRRSGSNSHPTSPLSPRKFK